MEQPKHAPLPRKLESGVRAIPNREVPTNLPDMRTPQDLFRVLQERRARGIDAGKIMDVYEAQERERKTKATLAELPIKNFPPAERPLSPRMTMAEALAYEKRHGNYGEVIPNLTEYAEDDIEDMTADAEDWIEEEQVAPPSRKPAPLPPRLSMAESVAREKAATKAKRERGFWDIAA